jgi:D-methionine transport system ATP-binding protein
MSLIEISGVRKSFGTATVLNGVDLTIPDGEIFGLVGVSGAGKSTLLRCINRLVDIDSGSIKVDGVDIADLEGNALLEYRRNVGMVFQQFSLMERRSVWDNVYLPVRCAGVKKREADGRIRELLDLVGLGNKADALPRELSGGQKQRVAIARALVSNPKLLLCDEATSALDPNVTEDVLDLLREINHRLGITIIVVTHEMSVMKAVCTRMGLLHDGHLAAAGDVKYFFLERPDLLEEFSRDVAMKPPAAEGQNRYRIILRSERETHLLARLATESGVPYQILWGGFDRYGTDVNGTFVVSAAQTDADRFETVMADLSVEWRKV